MWLSKPCTTETYFNPILPFKPQFRRMSHPALPEIFSSDCLSFFSHRCDTKFLAQAIEHHTVSAALHCSWQLTILFHMRQKLMFIKGSSIDFCWKVSF